MTGTPLNKLKNCVLLPMNGREIDSERKCHQTPGCQQSQRCQQPSGNPSAASKADEQAAGSITEVTAQLLFEVYIQFTSYMSPCSMFCSR